MRGCDMHDYANIDGRMIIRPYGIKTECEIVMPNHIHGIIVITDPIVGATPCVCSDIRQCWHNESGRHGSRMLRADT